MIDSRDQNTNIFSTRLRILLKKFGCCTKQSKVQAQFFQRMWNLFQTQTVQPGISHTRGLGYLRKTIESCHMVTTKEITLGLNPSFVCDDVILSEGRF